MRTDQAFGTAFVVAHRDATAQHPPVAAVAVTHAVLELENRGLAPQVVEQVGTKPRAVFRVNTAEPFQRPAPQLVFSEAEQALPSGGETNLVLPEVPIPETTFGSFDGKPVVFRRIPKGRFKAISLDS